MKLYRGLVQATVTGLQDIFSKHRQADRVVEQLLKSNKKWGARDRAFIAENIYEIVRWWRLVKFVCDLDRVADEEDFWIIFGAWQIIKPAHLHTDADNQLPEWTEFESLNIDTILNRYQEAMQIRKIAQSVPDWIDEAGEKALGEKWDKELAALNQPAPLILRINTIKSSIEATRETFGFDNTEVIQDVPNGLILKKRQNVAKLDTFKQGFFEVQDAGSQLIAPFLDIRPGLSVIDACAGAGGKTLHLAALLQNTGSILSMDIEGLKLEELKKRADRNGVTNLETMLITPEIVESLAGTADRLLLDVPCSGLGVLRRNPDSKWKLKPQFLESIRNVQWQILSSYCNMVKQGGKMVYATCSVLPSESEDQVKRFIEKYGKHWRLISEHRTSVADDGYDGFYMALLQKK
ncbi:RsmB/NOP family class I SAM-dependent RNA methyltransferase [Dyadobacter sp. NIV53]|uniref:RsmB/NOP family class I SAM-dependent RNA methyltransferase n=1 Tax=Dyadobacter sp. NIV53 TaxID=2861765 RepID=UPI001C882D3F|nr:RsmB/NOP family class I SAM-dependent RNA methyltransferase [Dyadobacter sp. NIV53]